MFYRSLAMHLGRRFVFGRLGARRDDQLEHQQQRQLERRRRPMTNRHFAFPTATEVTPF
jgi:hypothetical protein